MILIKSVQCSNLLSVFCASAAPITSFKLLLNLVKIKHTIKKWGHYGPYYQLKRNNK